MQRLQGINPAVLDHAQDLANQNPRVENNSEQLLFVAKQLEKDGDYVAALKKWEEIANDSQDAHAQCKCGELLIRGHEGIEKNDSKAFDYFTKAADQGDALAEMYLGDML